LDWALPRGVSVLKGVGESKATVENRCERRNGFDPTVEARKLLGSAVQGWAEADCPPQGNWEATES
jgi:hypothetical protein